MACINPKGHVLGSNKFLHPQFSSVQFSHSVMSDSSRPHGLKHTRLLCPSPTPGACSNSVSFELVMPSNHLFLCHPLLLLPSIFPSIRVFSSESVLHIGWPKYWTFSIQFSSVQSHPTLCDPMNHSMPGLPVHQPTPGVHSDSCPSSQ